MELKANRDDYKINENIVVADKLAELNKMTREQIEETVMRLIVSQENQSRYN
ncbi:MAG: hypothetical protein Q4G02_02975 [bacterium]|nr:hypothetical protein [bacterium]